jgi:radical SAM superfamily enzyme YgiQ (UPF0313 family)
MKILFITNDYLIDPLGISYLSSYLKAAGHKVDIIKVEKENIIAKLDEYRPNMLCYSLTTGKHKYYLELNKHIKDKRFSLFGGPHCTFFPETAKAPGVDAIVRGEGFDAIVDIANVLDSHHERIGKIVVESIDNVATCASLNPLRPLRDKNSLLFPDRELIYKYAENYNNPIKNIMCSFGCQYSCPYCYTKAYRELYNMNKIEIRSPDNVMAEIEELKQYPLKLLYFQDDNFPIWNKKWLRDFCELYSDYRIPFHIQIRIEILTEEVLIQLKNVGLHSLTFAIESGDEKLREIVLNRRVRNNIILEKVALLHKHKIKFRAENMLGIPHETLESALSTLDFNIKCKPTIAWASLYTPYLSTELGNYCKEHDLIDESRGIKEDFFTSSQLKLESRSRIERLQKLFSLICLLPFIRPFVSLLIRLPFKYNKIYLAIKRMLYKKLYEVN